MPYMLLIVEDPAQRSTRSEAEGKAVYQRMLDFGARVDFATLASSSD